MILSACQNHVQVNCFFNFLWWDPATSVPSGSSPLQHAETDSTPHYAKGSPMGKTCWPFGEPGSENRPANDIGVVEDLSVHDYKTRVTGDPAFRGLCECWSRTPSSKHLSNSSQHHGDWCHHPDDMKTTWSTSTHHVLLVLYLII